MPTGKHPVGDRVLGWEAGGPGSSPGSVTNRLHDSGVSFAPWALVSYLVYNVISKSPSEHESLFLSPGVHICAGSQGHFDLVVIY